jgi:flagellar biogenesis protein FliO
VQNFFDGTTGPTDNTHAVRRFLWVTVCALFLCCVPFGYYRFRSERPPSHHREFSLAPSARQSSGEQADDGATGVAEQIQKSLGMEDRKEKSLARSVEKICLGAAALLLLWGLVSAIRSRRYRLSSFAMDSDSQIRIVQTRRLGDKQCLAVVACERKKFLIAITPQNIGLIGSLDGVEPAPQKNASPDGNPS